MMPFLMGRFGAAASGCLLSAANAPRRQGRQRHRAGAALQKLATMHKLIGQFSLADANAFIS